MQLLTIESVIQEPAEVKTLVFREMLPYRAGQYLTFVWKEGAREVRRSYSLTGSPVLHEPLSVSIKRVENGIISRRLYDTARPGDQLYCAGAGGLFTLPEELAHLQKIVFFAAGSGITPIFSLIKTILHQHPSIPVVLFYSNRSAATTLFYADINMLQERFPGQFTVHYFFSADKQLAYARLYKDLFARLIDRYALPLANNGLYYLCGPESFMRMCLFSLRAEGVDNNAIRREIFNTTQPAFIPKPPDTETHEAFVHFNGIWHHFPVVYPDSILKSAQKHGLNLPYSCETGRCGSCVARCTEGNIWLSYNEVLTEKDLALGRTLTCTGHPVHGDIRLEADQ